MNYSIVIVRGLPGSGKTSWAKEQINLDYSLILVDDPSVFLSRNLDAFSYARSNLKDVLKYNSENYLNKEYKLIITDPEFTAMGEVDILKYLDNNLKLSESMDLNDLYVSIVDIEREMEFCRKKCVHRADMAITRLNNSRVEIEMATKIFVNDIISNNLLANNVLNETNGVNKNLMDLENISDNFVKFNWIGYLNHKELEYFSYKDLSNKFNIICNDVKSDNNKNDDKNIVFEKNYTVINNRLIKLR